MNIDLSQQNFRLETLCYRVRLVKQSPPVLEISRTGMAFFQLPIAAGLESLDSDETLSDITIQSIREEQPGQVRLVATASSSLWADRRFDWTFFEDHITFSQSAAGQGRLGKCYFFSNGVPGPWVDPAHTGMDAHMLVLARRVFSPAANLGNRHDYPISVAQSLGILNETLAGIDPGLLPPLAFDPEKASYIYTPPPLALCFNRDLNWVSIGIGARPGAWQFNALDYSGARQNGAAVWVDYHGYSQMAGQFDSPVAALHFGSSSWETLQAYIGWCDASGFATQHPYPHANWHRQPFFCGWAEQCYQGNTSGQRASDLATQVNYERWIEELENFGVPFGTVVIDDKWQAQYGTFEPDPQKWPDLRGFIDRQHAKGRRVLLWVPGYHPEGLPDAWCLYDGERKAAADVCNPDYVAYLRQQIRALIVNFGADGFKEDWIGGLTMTPGMHTSTGEPVGLYGIEFLRRFQYLLYDEAHRCKPDALVETQTPHPLFRESSDVLRLNDLYFGARNVVEEMSLRAQVARIAGWSLIDCDNASSTCLEEWWEYMLAQPRIGIPSLYCLHGTESTLETIPENAWPAIGGLWRGYLKQNDLL